MVRLALFEDEFTHRLNPLIHLRPVYDLKFGIRSIIDKYKKIFSDEFIALHCRDELSDLLTEKYPKAEINTYSADRYIFINGRSIIDEEALNKINTDNDALYVCEGVVAAAVLSGENLRTIRERKSELLHRQDFPDLVETEIKCKWLNYPWDLFLGNADEISREFSGGGVHGKIHENVSMVNEEKISIEEGAVVKPGVVLDAENGPIIISKNVHIMPNSVIQGPVFIGEDTLIKASARIYEGSSIGEKCKVGGEVAETIIHSYSNKQHDGFLGHSYLGQWVNLGADTNNSDLKNNYGNVQFYIEGELIDTGTKFCGLVMGDHSKSGINTMFNTGTHVGIACNIFGSGFPPKFIPSFSWGGVEGSVTHKIEKAIKTARMVMERRGVTMSSSEEQLFKIVFEKAGSE